MLDARASYLSRRRLCRDQGAGGGNYENQNDGGDQTICCDGSVRLMIQHAPASLVGAEVSNFARPYAVDPDRPSARKLPLFSASPPPPAASSAKDAMSGACRD
jgi:hypothetical protein